MIRSDWMFFRGDEQKFWKRARKRYKKLFKQAFQSFVHRKCGKYKAIVTIEAKKKWWEKVDGNIGKKHRAEAARKNDSFDANSIIIKQTKNGVCSGKKRRRRYRGHEENPQARSFARWTSPGMEILRKSL